MTIKTDDLSMSEIHRAIKEATPIAFDLNNYAVIQVTGQDTLKFLQGQLTCDLLKLAELSASLGALCTPKGRIIALFDLLKLSATECWLVLPKETLELTLSTLKKFAVFFQCDINDISDSYVVFGQNTSLDPQSNVQHLSDLPARQISRRDHGYIVEWDTNRTIEVVLKEQAALILQSFDKVYPETVWRYLDIEQGRARLHKSTQEVFLPHNLNLPKLGGVSFDKGCYTGQEVVARMHYKGKLKSHLFCFFSDNSEQAGQPGAAVYGDGQKMGEVVTCAAVGGKVIILAFCKDIIENSGKIQCNLENTSILSMSGHQK